MAKKKPNLGIQQKRTVDLAVREINEEERRVRVSFASEQAVQRWYGQEILCHDADCCNMDRLNNIGVALWNHDRNKVIGKIENASCDDNEKRCYCDIVFDEDDESERIYQKVKTKTLKGVSVGYSVDCWEEVKAGAMSSNGRFIGPCEIATSWTPYEVSIVSVPADDSVGVGRSIETEENNNEGDERQMSNPTNNNENINAQAERQAAIQAERQRVSEITTLCREFEIDSSNYVNNGNSVEEVRSQILEQLRERRKPAIASSADISVTKDELDKFRCAAVDSIQLRAGYKVEKIAEGARELRGMRLRDLAIECLQRSGVTNAQRLNNEELFKRALSPDSQFASILDSSVNKSMATAYKVANTTYRAWTGIGSNTDFKDATVYQISEAGELEKMTQTGEFKFDEMKDQGVKKSIATFGRTFGITRQALINDDIDVLTKIPSAYVRAADRGVNKLVYKTLRDNAKIYDGKELFHASHNNIGKAGAMSDVTLSELRTNMRKQKNLRGKETLNISPQFLIVPAGLETTAMKFLNSTALPDQDNAGVTNIWRNSFDLVVDAELDPISGALPYYVAANPADIDTIEVTYLNGDDMPKLESRLGFDFLGIEYRIYIDYGVSVLDYRGLGMNQGA
ncbi:MAG: prohead protease/major capsid protein fusion protein [Clostridium neonatale]